jgi:hypothetical protein
MWILSNLYFPKNNRSYTNIFRKSEFITRSQENLYKNWGEKYLKYQAWWAAWTETELSSRKSKIFHSGIEMKESAVFIDR